MTDKATIAIPFVRFTTDQHGVPLQLVIDKDEWDIAEVVTILRGFPEYQRQYEIALAIVNDATEWQKEAGIWEEAARRAQTQVLRETMQKHQLQQQLNGTNTALGDAVRDRDWYYQALIDIAACDPGTALDQIIALATSGIQGPPAEIEPPELTELVGGVK